jgi:hypothetical protein
MNLETLQTLIEDASQDELLRRSFCGTRSGLSQCLRDPFAWLQQSTSTTDVGVIAKQQETDIRNSEVDSLIDLLRVLQQRQFDSRFNQKPYSFKFSSPSKNNHSTYYSIAAGLLALVSAAHPKPKSKQPPPTALIQLAAEHFGSLWKSTTPKQTRVTGTDSPKLTTLFADAQLQRGLWQNEIVWRILEDWGAIDHKKPPEPDVEVVTPVLAAQGTDSGKSLWLRVRFYKHAQSPGYIAPLIPDLCAMALTRVDEACFNALSQVWDQTGLGRWMTGVWSLGEEIPGKFRKLHVDIVRDQPEYPTYLGGPSAQAAMLVALLAATGQPDDYEPDQVTLPACLQDRSRPPEHRNAEPLCLSSAISAQVENVSRAALGKTGRSIRSLKLEPIGKEPSKADAAQKYGLRTAVFCHDEVFTSGSDWDDAEQKTKDTRKAYGGEYQGLWIERAVTVGDALDVLLEQNRYIRAINLDAERKWEKQWLPQQPQPAEAAAQSDQSVPDRQLR